MAYLQKNVPPPNKVLTFTMNNFVGGLNNRSSQLQPNESFNLLNMKFDDESVMVKRDGVDYYDAHVITGSITYIDEFKPYQDTFQLIRASNTQVFSGTTKIADVAGKINGMNYMGAYYFVDGAKIRVYNKFPQAAGTYLKIVGTPVNSYVCMELVNPPAGYTPLPTEHISGVWVYDYATNRCWYEPCQNEINDTYKGANTLPTKPKYIEIHGDRLFLASDVTDDDNVYISDISNGFYFPVFLPLQLPPNGDKIVGLKSFHDSIVVGRKNDIYVIYGNTNRPEVADLVFRIKKVTTHTGFASQDAVDIVNNYLFYLGHDGNVYGMHTTKTDVDLLATQIINVHVDLFRTPINATVGDLSTASSVYYKDEWYLSIGDKTVVYSYRHKGFTMYRYSFLKMKSFYVQDYDLLYGGDNGRIMKNSTVYSDLGQPYHAFWTSMSMDMNEPTTYKQLREFYIVAHVFETYTSRIDVKFEIDYVNVDESYYLTNETSIWGKSKFGARFINRNIIASLPIVLGRRGRTLRFTMSNGYEPSAPVDTYAQLSGYPGLKEGTLVLVRGESKYYLYRNHEWVLQSNEDLFQPMKVYEVSGQYELRGKR